MLLSFYFFLKKKMEKQYLNLLNFEQLSLSHEKHLKNILPVLQGPHRFSERLFF